MNCSTCGVALPSGARFCPSCGSPCAEVPLAPAPETRKVVTVLFCDLVGSTALSGDLDPETLRSVTLRYFDLMRQRIEFHGGTVEKFIGDAVMAVFGVPLVHEDDARRALAAALDMRDALDDLNTELDVTLGVRLDARIGVNTGQVVSSADASARQALVSGETVNVAARLEQNAGAGQILIGPDTLRSAGASVQAEPVGPLLLKGKTEPVHAFRLLGLGEDDPELLRRFDVGFVGRDPELAALDAALRDVTEGRGARRIIVHGEAGLGKTRLLREWLHTRVPLYGVGRCRPYGDQGSLSPLADAVAMVTAASQAERDVTQAMSVLSGGLLLDGTPNPTVAETCVALVRVLSAHSVRQPMVLVLDDCHWAAPMLLDVTDRIVRELSAAVLLVYLARPELLDARPELSDCPSIAMTGLSHDESVLLAAELADVAAHWDAVPQRLLERANGNPLHLEQLLAAAEDTGSEDELPSTVQAVLGARIDALEPRERGVLDQASVIGREFSVDELVGPGSSREEVRSALLRLCGRRLVEPGPGSSFRFTSGLVQEVTYTSMSKRSRAEGHEKAAELPSVRAAGQAAIGGHLERAYGFRDELGRLDADTESLRGRAASVLGRAGAQALARSDLPWADDLLSRSTTLFRSGEQDREAAVRRLGEVRAALGRADEGRELLDGVLAAETDAVQAAHARLALSVLAPGEQSPADTAATVLPVFEQAEDHLGQARACLRLAQRSQSHGRHGEAERWLDRALTHSVRADGEPERAAALGAIGISLWRGPVPVPAAEARCLRLLDEHGGGRRTARMTLNCPLAVLSALNDEWSAARTRLAEAGRLAEELGYAETQVVLPLFGAMVEALAGDLVQARGLLEVAGAAAARLGATALQDTVALECARVHLDGGDVSAATSAIAGVSRSVAYPQSDAIELDGLLARIAAARGEREEALRLAARAVHAAELTDSPVVRGGALLDRARTLAVLGHIDAGHAAERAAFVFAAKGHRPGVRWAESVRDEWGGPR
ncbi:MAG TPA: adenylate/guanylate cyclase domain-containing protein [Actinospica sp.]|jgi:class 3 adenylate cyclase/tetratricopeptide (TPR) repeat protein|nr:adenylate/guanylate cyclase domain-containing protein [Actinospica sp.]